MQPPIKKAYSVDQIIEETIKKIDDIPDTCVEIKSFIGGTVKPCIPLVRDDIEGREGNEENKNVCCGAVDENNFGLSSILNVVLTSETTCLCSIGELLRYSIEVGTLENILSVTEVSNSSYPVLLV